jgi:hypothetical protein
LAALEEEIQALKRETEESTKIELETIKKIQEIITAPDRHFD